MLPRKGWLWDSNGDIGCLRGWEQRKQYHNGMIIQLIRLFRILCRMSNIVL